MANRLSNIINEETTLQIFLKSVSRSGMRRTFDVFVIRNEGGQQWLDNIGEEVAELTHYRQKPKSTEIVAHGVGMNYAGDIAQQLGVALFGKPLRYAIFA
ncbi:hypothetical protein NKY66_11065 [Sinorhizobium meliloti]|uniref:hypothetical protein n=1 Tax=Rhizobium meliloti TaxID=382 RepID=UPI003D64B7C7